MFLRLYSWKSLKLNKYLFTNLVVNSLSKVLMIGSLVRVVLSKKDRAGVRVPSILKEDLRNALVKL